METKKHLCMSIEDLKKEYRKNESLLFIFACIQLFFMFMFFTYFALKQDIPWELLTGNVFSVIIVAIKWRKTLKSYKHLEKQWRKEKLKPELLGPMDKWITIFSSTGLAFFQLLAMVPISYFIAKHQPALSPIAYIGVIVCIVCVILDIWIYDTDWYDKDP